jgi:hypothetical protein
LGPRLNTMSDERCWLAFKLAQNFHPTSCNNVGPTMSSDMLYCFSFH